MRTHRAFRRLNPEESELPRLWSTSYWTTIEILDGFHDIVAKTDQVTVFSRRGHDFSRRFRTIASNVGNLPNDTIADGEVVALDSDGRPNFNALQNGMRGHSIYFYAFDLMAYRGKNVMNQPLSARLALLERMLARAADPIRLSPIFPMQSGGGKLSLNQ